MKWRKLLPRCGQVKRIRCSKISMRRMILQLLCVGCAMPFQTLCEQLVRRGGSSVDVDFGVIKEMIYGMKTKVLCGTAWPKQVSLFSQDYLFLYSYYSLKRHVISLNDIATYTYCAVCCSWLCHQACLSSKVDLFDSSARMHGFITRPRSLMTSIGGTQYSFKMFGMVIGRSVIRPISRTSIPCLHQEARHFHPSLTKCERRRASPSGKMKRKQKGQKYSKPRRSKAEEKQFNQQSSQVERVPPQISAPFETSGRKSTERSENLSSLPLELWSKSKSDATFFHGRDELASKWSPPSVHTSQHPAVKAVLKDIAASNDA